MKSIVIKRQPDGKIQLSIDGRSQVCDTWEEAIKKAEEDNNGNGC